MATLFEWCRTGSVVTFSLFFLMQAVIATDEARLDEGAKGKLLTLFV